MARMPTMRMTTTKDRAYTKLEGPTSGQETLLIKPDLRLRIRLEITPTTIRGSESAWPVKCAARAQFTGRDAPTSPTFTKSGLKSWCARFRSSERDGEFDHSAVASQDVIDRLARIEHLLQTLPLSGINNNASLGSDDIGQVTPSVSNIAVQSPVEQRHNHPLSESDLIVGHSLKGLSRIVGHPTPQQLLPLAEEAGETYLESQSKDMLAPTAILHTLGPPLVPVHRSGGTCFVLFILALGSIAKEDYRGDAGSGFSGLEYFQAAAGMICRPRGTIYSIMQVQCRILMTFYFLFSLRPIQAFDTIHQASLAVLGLLQFKSRMEGDSGFRQHVYRAYWACYLLEHELQSIVSYSSCLLQLQNEFVPLPSFEHDEPGSYWFLSEIAFRKIFSNSRDGFGWNTFTLHRGAVVNEIILQLQQWYDYLPTQIKFPMTIGPLMDSHKVFLRAQYYAVVAVLHWSSIVRLLTSPPRDEQEHITLLKSGRQALESCILHVHAVESLLQERHLMLFANISGLNCVASLLASTYNVPALQGIQPANQDEAIRKARNMLASWASSNVISSYVSGIDKLMLSKGINLRLSYAEPELGKTTYGGASF
ncbi:hypothetical protein B0A52_07280 [Exophiala mesophila]|uniref:Transcription factor domain-containing protein n=1 Tax=Exophiala mesophila TaxID=212818 RepID=A0A438MWZ4_EXOME|nr:hypothetical protein B0A52_07280 [Exophiala mesophila]